MRKLLVFILLTCPAVLFAETLLFEQIETAARSVEGLNDSERGELLQNIRDNLPGSLLERNLDEAQLSGFTGMVNAGLFEEVEIPRIGRTAGMGIVSMLNGADPEAVAEMALIGFSRQISEIQLRSGAKALKIMQAGEVPAEIYQEAVSYAVYNSWTPNNIIGLAEGILRGKRESVALDKLTLALIIRVDQGLGGTPIAQAVEEEIAYIIDLETTDPERIRRDAIYQSMKAATAKGLPTDIAREFYHHAVEEGWSATDAGLLFEGLGEGVGRGLTAEKLALALIIRMEMEGGKVSVRRIIREETDYVASLESRSVALKQDDRKNRPTIPQPPAAAPRRGLNITLLQSSINSFLGTPYVWGGTTRKGIDCSGFTMSVYREQGIRLPRVSYQQYMYGIPVDKGNLAFGDLVFFNKNGWGRVSHVGIYIGGGKFAHSSCSRGVTISNLNQGYYRRSYSGGKRMVI